MPNDPGTSGLPLLRGDLMVAHTRGGRPSSSHSRVRGERQGRAVEQVTATRSELLARRAQIDLAQRGRDLLEDKREQLLSEFRKVADLVLADSGALERAAGQAREALALAEGWDGAWAVRSAVLAVQAQPAIRTRTVSIMGLRLAEIEHDPVGRPRTGRGMTLAGSTARIDLAAERFETEIELLLRLAGRELRLRRLVDEIARTTRRLNALELVVLPRLRAEAAAIRAVLGEREREDRFRLKQAKERRNLRWQDGP